LASLTPPCCRCAALCAREHVRRDAPAWAPSLPLTWEDIEKLENDDSNRLQQHSWNQNSAGK
ncbi:MAG: hypothetical protein WAM50_07325, partial [Pseudolabrys sp.]